MTETPAPAPPARDVVLAALAAALPCPTCGRTDPCRCLIEERPRVEARADLIVAALIEYGHLPGPDVTVTEAEVHEVARWLADQSRHPRYTQSDDGWRKLLQADADVVLAAHCALAYAPESEAGEIVRARALLREYGDALRAQEAEDRA